MTGTDLLILLFAVSAGVLLTLGYVEWRQKPRNVTLTTLFLVLGVLLIILAGVCISTPAS